MSKLQATITAIGLALTAGMLITAPNAQLLDPREPNLEAPSGVRRMIQTLQSCESRASYLDIVAAKPQISLGDCPTSFSASFVEWSSDA